MDATDPADRLEDLAREECLELLGAQRIGRLGFVAGGQPRIEPVNYQLVDGDILFASRPGAKLDAAVNAARVAFEIDALEEWARAGWSVLAVGTARTVSDDKERARLAASAPEPWAEGPGLTLIRIVVDDLTGRRVRLGPGSVSRVVQEPDTPRPEW